MNESRTHVLSMGHDRSFPCFGPYYLARRFEEEAKHDLRELLERADKHGLTSGKFTIRYVMVVTIDE